MPIRERVLSMGITGSGKTYQWLKMADTLLPTGATFRCLDTDNAIPYMLETHFPQLKPENGGNVLVFPTPSWPDYKLGVNWLQRKPVKAELLKGVSPLIVKDWPTPLKDNDWTVVDMIDKAWDTVQGYFVQEVFGEEPGDYFLEIRKALQTGKKKPTSGGSPVAEGLDGWKDWSVINKLYNDWILPIIYRVQTHVYAAARVERIDRSTKDEELLTLFGGTGVRPAGQKALGHQVHAIFLFIPGEDKWFVTTVKDRSGRSYFKKTPLVDLHMQYFVAKAGWPIITKEE